MALPSNKSSSLSMVAGRTSPNSRNSEIGNPVRRSFSGNPFSKPSIVANPRSLNPITPANSPSDYPRRNSVSREILFTSRDNEEKENGKDQSPKPVRVRSPTVGKSTKHFMSPTISAASKIAVSPKKKILGDRNEPVRSSLSFSSMKSSSLNSVNSNPEASTVLESDTNPQIAPVSNPKSSKTVRFGGFEVISSSYEDSESTYRYDTNPEVVTMAVETDTKPEIAPISNSTFAAAPSKSSKTVKFGGLEVISDSADDSESTYRYDTSADIVTMAVEADKPEITLISNSAIAAAPLKASKTVRFAGIEVISVSNNDLESPAKSNLTEEVDCVNLDPSFKISPDSSPMEAPLDADSLIPPYDPKTNYLSPRPQFLHYRPNRRINRYETDGRLEELFSSANVSESEFTEETDSEDPQKESDETSSIESQMEGEEEEEGIDVSEQSPTEVKKSSKPYFSRTFKISSLLLILFTACFSIHVVNVHGPHIFERASLLTMEDPSEIYESAKTNFHVLVGKLEVWHGNSKSFISDIVFNIRGGGRPSIYYLNQTAEFLYKDVNADGLCLVSSHQTLWEEENSLNVVEEAMTEREIDIVEEPVEREDQNEEGEEQEQEEDSLQEIETAMKEIEIDIVEPVERESQNEVEEELFQEVEAKANDSRDSEEETDEASAKSASEESLEEIIEETSTKSASEESLQEIIEETSTDSASDQLDEEDDIQEKQTEENYEASSSPDQEAATGETEEETNDSMQQSNTEFKYQSPPVSPPSEPQSDVEEESGSNIDLIGTAADHGISRDFTQNTAVIISAILLGTLIIPSGLIYARKSGSKPSSMAAIAEEQAEKPLLKENNTDQSPVEEEEEEALDDDHDDDVAGEFSSSEMSMSSSFQYSSMREGETKEMKRPNEEAQSHSQSHGRKKMRKNSRRESMASSSLDEYSVSTSSASPSYGSFTTYEKIPMKHHGNGEEEIVTPVRRSSRIRKAATQQ